MFIADSSTFDLLDLIIGVVVVLGTVIRAVYRKIRSRQAARPEPAEESESAPEFDEAEVWADPNVPEVDFVAEEEVPEVGDWVAESAPAVAAPPAPAAEFVPPDETPASPPPNPAPAPQPAAENAYARLIRRSGRNAVVLAEILGPPPGLRER